MVPGSRRGRIETELDRLTRIVERGLLDSFREVIFLDRFLLCKNSFVLPAKGFNHQNSVFRMPPIDVKVTAFRAILGKVQVNRPIKKVSMVAILMQVLVVRMNFIVTHSWSFV